MRPSTRPFVVNHDGTSLSGDIASSQTPALLKFIDTQPQLEREWRPEGVGLSTVASITPMPPDMSLSRDNSAANNARAVEHSCPWKDISEGPTRFEFGRPLSAAEASYGSNRHSPLRSYAQRCRLERKRHGRANL